jgi:hypothetical protein
MERSHLLRQRSAGMGIVLDHHCGRQARYYLLDMPLYVRLHRLRLRRSLSGKKLHEKNDGADDSNP